MKQLLPDPPAEPSTTTDKASTKIMGHSADFMTINDYLQVHRNELPDDAFPLRMSLINAEQQRDIELQTATNKPASQYRQREVHRDERQNRCA